eukprot:464730-Pyramimonas_sp.AAC.1
MTSSRLSRSPRLRRVIGCLRAARGHPRRGRRALYCNARRRAPPTSPLGYPQRAPRPSRGGSQIDMPTLRTSMS